MRVECPPPEPRRGGGPVHEGGKAGEVAAWGPGARPSPSIRLMNHMVV